MTAPLRYQYRVGGHLPVDFPSYVMRTADRQLYQGLIAGELCYVLNSRQMGKTSLRFRTMKLLQAEGIACAAIDLQAIGSRNITVQQWYAGLVKRLVQGFGLTDRFNFRGWWQEQDLLSPVQRWCDFIETILPQLIHQPIVIFIDEIDSTLILEFNTDDFFASIRACNERENLTFALFGVAAPADLIKDSTCSPFNIGHGIELRGFQAVEAYGLATGLQDRANDPAIVLQEILNWTGGQPFLTQKLCKFVQELPTPILAGDEEREIERLVRLKIISDWEIQDEPEHLRTIHNRLKPNSLIKTNKLLYLYQKILHDGYVTVNEDPAQLELRLSGVVVKERDHLQIQNPIYAHVFDRQWLDRVLMQWQPSKKLSVGGETAGRQDESLSVPNQVSKEDPEFSSRKVSEPTDRELSSTNKKSENRSQKSLTIRKLLLGSIVSVLVIATFSTLLFSIFREDKHDQIRTLVYSSRTLLKEKKYPESLLKGIEAARLFQENKGEQQLREMVAKNLRVVLREMKIAHEGNLSQLIKEGCLELQQSSKFSAEVDLVCPRKLRRKKSQ
jgi:hypothetical protein